MAKHLVAEKLGPTFGQGGDFTVVVEEHPHAESVEDSDAEPTRTEFKVWSLILSSWSEVFDKMMNQDFVESAKKQVVIKDFSSLAVKTFLKFLYMGTLDAPPETICEVSAIADKYQVLELKPICLKMLEDTISVTNAWAILQLADHFQSHDIRQKSKQTIFVKAKEALKSRPLVRDELVEEVLGSSLLCVTDEELFSLLLTGTDSGDQIKSRTLINKWVSMANVPANLKKNFMEVDEYCEKMKSMRKRGEHTTDLLNCVRIRFEDCSHGKPWNSDNAKLRPLFLADWVSLSYSMTDTRCYEYIFSFAAGSNTTGIKMRAGDWMEWRLPKLAAHLMAIKLTENLRKSDHLEIFCAADCSAWHRVFSSQDHGAIAAGTVVKCGCECLVQRFKVHMLSGEFSPYHVKFECILREL
eukprot:s1278_g3.t1